MVGVGVQVECIEDGCWVAFGVGGLGVHGAETVMVHGGIAGSRDSTKRVLLATGEIGVSRETVRDGMLSSCRTRVRHKDWFSRG